MSTVETYQIKTAQGKVVSGDLPFLSEGERLALDQVGYQGRDPSGARATRAEYLNSLGKGSFEVVRTGQDSSELTEELTIGRCTDPEQQIEIFRIVTSSGNMVSGSLPFMSESELAGFNKVGYTGLDPSGKSATREEYLNSLGKGTFQVTLTASGSAEFTENYTIVRCFDDSKMAEPAVS